MENKIKTNKTVFAIILAAGYSSRMGAFKPLLPMGEKTAVERIIETLEHAKIGKIVVVAGYQKERIHHCLAGKNVVIADNDDFDKGMFSSIQRGMEEGMKGAGNQGESMEYTGFFLNLVDSPLTPVWVLEKILQEHEKNRDVMIVPCYKGKKGHPLFIPSKYFAEILKYDGSGGLKAITNRYDHELRRIEVDSEEVVLDMDTPEAYEELKAYDRHKEEEASCGELLKKFGIKRLVLIRHGQPRQHEGKILLGQTDLPLSQKGRKEAVDAGEELWKLKVNGNRIYTSDLKRAHETAEAIGEVFAKHEERGADSQTLLIAQTPAFREMNLGVWDGK
ncbi:MAG: NTP transferase domain-containing protein, partial [Anaerovorax sp.]